MTDEPAPAISRGDAYDAPYERRAAAGEDVHGEAVFVRAFAPSSVLDAGCGTGRVGRELERHGIAVVGVDLDGEMLETARRKAPQVRWILADLARVSIGRSFDVVLMAGNVINFAAPSDRGAVVENMTRHVAPGGLLINGHSVRPDGCQPRDFAGWASAAGLELIEQWSTWQRAAFRPDSEYSLTVHRRPRAG